jgi:hypothetical protein
MLLIVDDVWSAVSARSFKLGRPNCAYLLTTRLFEVAIDFAGEEYIRVCELSEEDGLTLLTRLTPQAVASEPAEARELVQAVGALPLALTLMGKYLQVQFHSKQQRRLRKALDQLHQVEERLQLEQLQAGLERHPSLPLGTPISLQTAIRISDNALNGTARLARRSLSVFPPKPNTFSEDAALTISASPLEALDMLTNFGLVGCDELGRYTLHQAIVDYTKANLTPALRRAWLIQTRTHRS